MNDCKDPIYAVVPICGCAVRCDRLHITRVPERFARPIALRASGPIEPPPLLKPYVRHGRQFAAILARFCKAMPDPTMQRTNPALYARWKRCMWLLCENQHTTQEFADLFIDLLGVDYCAVCNTPFLSLTSRMRHCSDRCRRLKAAWGSLARDKVEPRVERVVA